MWAKWNGWLTNLRKAFARLSPGNKQFVVVNLYHHAVRSLRREQPYYLHFTLVNSLVVVVLLQHEIKSACDHTVDNKAPVHSKPHIMIGVVNGLVSRIHVVGISRPPHSNK